MNCPQTRRWIGQEIFEPGRGYLSLSVDRLFLHGEDRNSALMWLFVSFYSKRTISAREVKNVVNPETLRQVGAALEKTWTLIGSLVGLGFGAFLTRSWDRKKWMKDNRKEECRELLSAVTRTVD